MEGVVGLPNPAFWRGRRVLLTGHTGFKGGWLALWLERLGAEVCAFALPPAEGHSFYAIAGIGGNCTDRFIDLTNATDVRAAVAEARPEVVLHLGAQALVRRSLREPAFTFAVNVTGTLNLLEATREASDARAVLVVTSDKVYFNDATGRAFTESDRLGGTDPYSASKAACELAVASFAKSMLDGTGTALATARAGNVIGGGDFAEDRIVADCVRAALSGTNLTLRHPRATRPWQYVLDCLCGYLLYAERLAAGAPVPEALNFGPAAQAEITVWELAEEMMRALDAHGGIEVREPARSVEAPRLALDSSAARRILSWRDRIPQREAVAATAAWYREWQAGADMRKASLAAIDRYQAGGEIAA